MKKSINLFALLLLPFGLVACSSNSNSSSQIPNYIVIEDWLDADKEIMKLIHPEIQIPYYKGVFETIGTEVSSGTTSEELPSDYVPTYTYESNYSLTNYSYLNKIGLIFPTGDVEVVNGYLDLISDSTNQFVKDEELTNEGKFDYFYYKTINSSQDFTSKYYLNVYFESNSIMYVFAYIENEYVSNSWPSEAIETYMLANSEDKEIFPSCSNNVSKVIYTQTNFAGNLMMEFEVTSNDSNELEAYKESLTAKGYKIDPYYETKDTVHYYLIVNENTDDAVCYEVNISKQANNNTFNMSFMLTY